MRVEPAGGERRTLWDRLPIGQRRAPTPPTQPSSTPGPITRAPPILSRTTTASSSNYQPNLNPATAAPPEPERARSRMSRRVVVGLVVLLLVVLGLSAALVVTNLRISGRPDLSNRQVGAIAHKQASSAVSQLQS